MHLPIDQNLANFLRWGLSAISNKSLRFRSINGWSLFLTTCWWRLFQPYFFSSRKIWLGNGWEYYCEYGMNQLSALCPEERQAGSETVSLRSVPPKFTGIQKSFRSFYWWYFLERNEEYYQFYGVFLGSTTLECIFDISKQIFIKKYDIWKGICKHPQLIKNR